MADKTLSEIFRPAFNRNMVIHDGDFGIEIETETAAPYDPPEMTFWKNHRDGSLRNFGVEYVLKVPLSYPDAKTGLDEFFQKNRGRNFLDSVYCSVHVHVNMLKRTPLQLANFVTAYVLLENILTKYSGPDRESNLFCLSIKDAEGCFNNMQTVLDAFTSPKKIRNLLINEDHAKYSALNFVTLTKIGSVELRTFRGSHDEEEIWKWISIVNKLLEFSKAVDNPTRVFELAYNDPVEFVNVVFGELAREFPYDIPALIKPQVYYAAKLSTLVPSWENFGQPKPKVVSKKVYLDKMNETAMGLFGTPFNDLTPAQRILVEEHFSRTFNARHEVFILEEDV